MLAGLARRAHAALTAAGAVTAVARRRIAAGADARTGGAFPSGWTRRSASTPGPKLTAVTAGIGRA
jgi:hypothetical protein